MGARFSAPVQTSPGAHPASYTMGTGSFPWVKRPGRGVNHPPPSSTDVEGRVELYIYYPSGPSWPVPGRTLLLLYFILLYFTFHQYEVVPVIVVAAVPTGELSVNVILTAIQTVISSLSYYSLHAL